MEPVTTHEAYLLVTTTAFDLARNGHSDAGYTCLLAGLQRAEELRDEGLKGQGEGRGAELVARYRAALGLYTEKYGAAG